MISGLAAIFATISASARRRRRGQEHVGAFDHLAEVRASVTLE